MVRGEQTQPAVSPFANMIGARLTNLYNENPTWLQNAHRKLDEAVFAAYSWPSNLSDDEVLARLLELNLKRAAAKG